MKKFLMLLLLPLLWFGQINTQHFLKDSQVDWKINNGKLNFTLLKEGEPITTLRKADREKLEILVVNEDFTFFQHSSAIYKGEGRFEGDFPLQKGENYAFFLYMNEKVIASYHPKKFQTVLQKDRLMNKKVAELEIALLFEPLYEGEISKLTFNFHGHNHLKNTFTPIAKEGALLYIINETATKLMIISPNKNTTSFPVVFRERGMYKMWGEVSYGGEQITFTYVIDVLKKDRSE